MVVIVESVTFRMDDQTEVADITVRIAGKQTPAGPGGTNRFTLYGLEAVRLYDLRPGTERELTLEGVKA